MAIFLQVALLAVTLFTLFAVSEQNGGRTNHCDSNPCLNGGTCHRHHNGQRRSMTGHHGFWCDCSNTGHIGHFCSEVITAAPQAVTNAPDQSSTTTTTTTTRQGTTQPTIKPTTTTTTTTTTPQPTTSSTTPLPTTTARQSTPTPTQTSTTPVMSLHSVTCGKFSTVSELANQITVHNRSAARCPSGNHTSPEAFTLSNCNLALPPFWKQGVNVMQNCLTIPKYSPIAVFGPTGYVSNSHTISGVFLGCTVQPTGVKVAVQECDNVPHVQTHVPGGPIDPNSFHVINY